TASANTLTSAISNPFTLTFVDVVNVTNATQVSLYQDPDGSHFDWKMGGTVGAIPLDDPNGLTINGDGANDPIYLDYSYGNPFPGVMPFNGPFTIARLQGPTPFAGTTMEIGQSTLYFVYSAGQSLLPAVQSALASAYNAGAWSPATVPASGLIT